MVDRPRRIAVLSIHGCPMVELGGKYRGGMNLYIRELYRQLGRAGLEVDVYSRRHDPGDPEIVPMGEGARTIHITAGEQREVPRDEIQAHLPEFTQAVLQYAESHGRRYDLVHSHYWLSGLAGVELSAHWKVPHVVTFHTLGRIKAEAYRGAREPEARMAAEGAIMSAADYVLTLTPTDRDLTARFYDVAHEKVGVIPAGVNTELFRPLDKRAARDAIGLNGQKVILFVGRIEPLKGIDILLRAVPILEEHQQVHVLIAGADSYAGDELLPESGSEQGRLQSLADELGIGSGVSFLGPVEHEKLPVYYSAADVCVIPSFYESFGMVAVEAMACGTPVVASRVGGLQATVRDGITGYLIPWQCPEPFAERLEVILSNEALARGLGAAGRATMQHYSWARVAHDVLALYENLMGARGPA